MENAGYEFEAAEASFDLLVQKAAGIYRPWFERLSYRVDIEAGPKGEPLTEARVKVRVGAQEMHTVSEGDGPVNALDGALRKALQAIYPATGGDALSGLQGARGQRPRGDGGESARGGGVARRRKNVWGTVGVSENIVEASWLALADAVEYKLFKDGETPKPSGTKEAHEMTTVVKSQASPTPPEKEEDPWRYGLALRPARRAETEKRPMSRFPLREKTVCSIPRGRKILS